jgi:four helix bundle protein
VTERPHRRLLLWQKSVDLVAEVYRATRSFPSPERFGLSGQIQRAAISIPANIAEGAARKSRKEYVQFLYVARGSISELDTHFEIARRLGYLDADSHFRLQERLEECSRMANALISSLRVPSSPSQSPNPSIP